MNEIKINGESVKIPNELGLQEYLNQELAVERLREPFAVALNGEFLPRSRYGEVSLREGDCLDIVTPVGGG